MYFKSIFLLIVTVAFFGSCNQNEIHKLDGDILEATGYYENGLAYDGCDKHFSLVMTDSTYISYTPSDASMGIIRNIINDKDLSSHPASVRVRFQLTGDKRKVQCGWGRTPLFEEINVIEIEKI